MNQLRATSYDASIDLVDFSGEVSYLFDRACYITHPDGRMTMVVSSDTGELPSGICADIPVGFKFGDIVMPGARVAVRGGVLRFEGANLSIELRFARPRVSPPRGAFAGRSWEATEAAWNEAWAAAMILITSSSHNSDDLFRQFSAVIDEYSKSRESLSFAIHAKQFLGRGPGLTPAGDDYIVGYMAGAWLIGSIEDDDPHQELATWITMSLEQTGDVSKNFLRGATRGVFPERLVSLCTTIVSSADFGAVGDAVRRMAAFGQSSGLCMALGLLCALISLSERVDHRDWAINQETHNPNAGVSI